MMKVQPLRFSPHISAVLGVLVLELIIGVGTSIATADDPKALVSRLPYFVAVPLTIYVAYVALRPLIRRQVVMMGVIQVVIGVALTVLGAVTGAAAEGFFEPVSTGLAIAGPALVMTAIYVILADLRFIDVELVSNGPGRRYRDHTHLFGNEQVHYRTFEGVAYDSALLDDCINMVSYRSVHFVAVFAAGEAQFHVDVLTNPRLERDRGALAPDEWRARLDRAGRQLMALDQRINTGIERIHNGTLVRMVIDTHPGGLLLYRLDEDGRYLLGATLQQTQILLAQDKLDVLARKHQRFPRGEPYAGPSRARDLVIEYPTVALAAQAREARVLMAEYGVSSALVRMPAGGYRVVTVMDLLRAGLPQDVTTDPRSASHHEPDVLADVLIGRTVAQCLPGDAPEAPVVAPTTPSLEVAGRVVSAGSPVAAVVESGVLLGAIPVDSLIVPGANV